jgi:hypothetical protein
MTQSTLDPQVHSPAWVFQSWASFAIAVAATGIGIAYVPAEAWTRGFLAMGLLFTVGATLNIAKTIRDVHESRRMYARVDEARVEKLLAEHHPLK